MGEAVSALTAQQNANRIGTVEVLGWVTETYWSTCAFASTRATYGIPLFWYVINYVMQGIVMTLFESADAQQNINKHTQKSFWHIRRDFAETGRRFTKLRKYGYHAYSFL